MEHFVVDDIFDYVSGNRRAVQHRVNPYDFLLWAKTPETYGPGPTPSFPRSPGDGATKPAAEIDRVESLEIAFQIDMLSLWMKMRASPLYRDPGRPDLSFVSLDEGSQETSVPDRRPADEGG